MTLDELLTYLFPDQAHVLVAPLTEWMQSSRRYKTFVETYRDKIRKKIRGVRDEAGVRDLLFELATAELLLRERRFTLEYEKFGIGKQRGPDFSVTFKTWIVFNIEVTRMRGASPDDPKCIDMVCGKVAQMPPQAINILLIAVDSAAYGTIDLARAMKHLQARVEHKDDEFFARRGFDDTKDFLKHYHRLSGVLLRETSDLGFGAGASLWSNALARHPMPADLYSILRG